jgi:hypothetical protein
LVNLGPGHCGVDVLPGLVARVGDAVHDSVSFGTLRGRFKKY